MNNEFVEALKKLTKADRSVSTRAFFITHAFIIREQMMRLERPLSYFFPLIRMALRREEDLETGRKADPPDGRVISFRSAEVYMSEFAPARKVAASIKLAATQQLNASQDSQFLQLVAKKAKQIEARSSANGLLAQTVNASAASTPAHETQSRAAVTPSHSSENERLRRQNSVNATPGLPD
jgi:hypothetical protein